MPLTRLTLTDFRSYAHAEIELRAGFVVLTGDNGAGKTNVLEAVSLLAAGRGLRGALLGDMARSGGPGGFSVAADLNADVQLGTGTRATAPERRIVRINGAGASATAFGEWLSIVWLTPAQDRLFTDSPGGRRRFLDRLVLAIDPAHATRSARYEAAMRQRNRLLADPDPDRQWLDALEAAMAEHGNAIAAARADLIIDLTTEIARNADDLFPRADLTMDGAPGDDLATQLANGRARDAAAGRTLVGPHRQDLIVTHHAKAQPAARASTGEQKALLIGIVLAHAALICARSGLNPLLLLDEVAAHLDPLRRAALYERLAETRAQIWLTGTEPSLFDAIPANASRFNVACGRITRA